MVFLQNVLIRQKNNTLREIKKNKKLLTTENTTLKQIAHPNKEETQGMHKIYWDVCCWY